MKDKVAAILAEAKGKDFGAPGAHKALAASVLPTGISLATFKAAYPAIRGVLLAAIGLLKLFHRGDAAAGIAQAIAFLDVIVGTGQVPA